MPGEGATQNARRIGVVLERPWEQVRVPSGDVKPACDLRQPAGGRRYTFPAEYPTFSNLSGQFRVERIEALTNALADVIETLGALVLPYVKHRLIQDQRMESFKTALGII